jgi:inner membrane protein
VDSLTQIALGAAVGEATLGHRVGRVAAGWGAVLGTVPDLDILLYPFLDAVDRLAMHRGISHSIAFAVVAAPVFGVLLARLHRARGEPAVRWGWLAFWVIITHIALDCLTVYGTQIFQPFSNHPVGLDSIFIIDPLYTLPLAAGVLWTLVRRDGTRRGRANLAGLALSTAYLALTLVNKAAVDRAFRAGLEAEGIRPERVMTAPTPLNNVLWMGVAESRDTLWVGLTGLLDDGPPTRFTAVPRRTALLDGHEGDRAVRSLEWFSKGWWAAEVDSSGALYVNDLRFGRTDSWLTDSGEYVFRFRLVAEGGRYVNHEQVPPDLRMSGAVLRGIMGRIEARGG